MIEHSERGTNRNRAKRNYLANPKIINLADASKLQCSYSELIVGIKAQSVPSKKISNLKM
jgi:hypothetical protein